MGPFSSHVCSQRALTGLEHLGLIVGAEMAIWAYNCGLLATVITVWALLNRNLECRTILGPVVLTICGDCDVIGSHV